MTKMSENKLFLQFIFLYQIRLKESIFYFNSYNNPSHVYKTSYDKFSGKWEHAFHNGKCGI